MIEVVMSVVHSGWDLIVDGEEVCEADNVSFNQALNIFAADHPELAKELDDLNADDLCGAMPSEKRRAVRGREKKRGSGARFRELIMAGKTNAESLTIVRSEFPDSKATLSDAAWNRALLRKNPAGFAGDGSKV